MAGFLDNILNKITEKNNLVKITGLTAILGMIFIFIADYKLLYMPLSSRQYSVFQAAAARSSSDILFYSKVAVFATPLVLIGLFHLYLTLSIANKLLARVTVGIYAFAYVNAALFYAFLAYVMSMAHLVIPIKLGLPYILKHIYRLFQMQYNMGIIAASILFFLAIGFFKGKNYPKWFTFVNPLYLVVIFRVILPLGTPPVIDGFLVTTAFNLVMLITFIISVIIMWKKPMNRLMPETPE